LEGTMGSDAGSL